MRAIQLADLERAVAAADPAAYLVTRRVLRRVIRRDRGLIFLGRIGSRQSTYTLPAARLQRFATPDELTPDPARQALPGTVILLERPRAEDLAREPAGALLVTAWRRLFRARVQEAVLARVESGAIDPAGLAGRVERLGTTAFAEARQVFRHDGWLIPPDTDAEVYALFSAHVLELVRFAPALLRSTFPALTDVDAVEGLLREDVDADSVQAATRPPGAPEPGSVAPAQAVEEADWDDDPGLSASFPTPVPDPKAPRDRSLAGRARAAMERGNFARAAILYTQAADEAGSEPGAGSRQRSDARSALRKLARRVQPALGPGHDDMSAWPRALSALLPAAARGFWTAEARLLFDLQRVGIDHHREIDRIDPVGWALSLGRTPLRVPLPHANAVSVASRLHAAVRRLPHLRLSRADRVRLEDLLRPAGRSAERVLRERLRPAFERVLDATWVRPANLPERVARSNMVESLLDRVTARRHTSLGELRDAASVSDLKLPDLAGPRDFLRGGRLLVADRALARELDGVHRRGEVYLRWLQRLSMLAFATPVGRLLTLFLVLPYGGAFVALKGLQHLLELVHVHVAVFDRWSFLTLGTLALGVINFVRFRREFFLWVRRGWRAARAVVYDLPARLVDTPFVRRLLRSRLAAWAWQFALKPGLIGLPAGLVAAACGAGRAGALVAWAAFFVGSTLLLNTRAGRSLEEVVADAVVHGWRGLGEAIPGLFRLVMAFFEWLLELAERAFYSVDEWLLFRAGASRGSLAFKAVVSPFWRGAEYLGRAVLNVLVEPQVNPIKHFPVVTVSHKLLLPMLPVVIAGLTPLLGPVYGKAAAGVIQFLLPGAFGFLVWELNSNWRLYEANRPRSLVPVVVGGHGETVVRLLRPGLHSGTIPKAFARLRRARRRVWLGSGTPRPEKAALRQRERLHHVEEDVRRFAERDLVALLAGSRAPADTAERHGLEVTAVELATNRVRVEIGPPAGPAGSALVVDLEERDGTLSAGVAHPGWLDRLAAPARRAVDDALSGWFLRSGVVLVRTPGTPFGSGPRETPVTAPVRLDAHPVSWSRWVATWDAEAAGLRGDDPLVGPQGILPGPGPPARSQRVMHA